MIKYKAIAPITLYSGKVQITAAQAEPRAHLLKSIVELKKKPLLNAKDEVIPGKFNGLIYIDGVYEINPGPCNFKAGETFGYDGDMPKAFNNFFENVSDPAPVAEKKSKK